MNSRLLELMRNAVAFLVAGVGEDVKASETHLSDEFVLGARVQEPKGRASPRDRNQGTCQAYYPYELRWVR